MSIQKYVETYYTASVMSYEVGTKINFNTSADEQATTKLYTPGTQILFDFSNQAMKSFRRIPVVFA